MNITVTMFEWDGPDAVKARLTFYGGRRPYGSNYTVDLKDLGQWLRALMGPGHTVYVQTYDLGPRYFMDLREIEGLQLQIIPTPALPERRRWELAGPDEVKTSPVEVHGMYLK